MTHDDSLPTAAPVTVARSAAPKSRLRLMAAGALIAGLAASATVFAIAQPSQAELSASGTVVDQSELPLELTIGSDAMGDADQAVEDAQTAIEGAASSVDTEELSAYVAKLEDYSSLDRSEVVGLTADASSATETVIAETAEAKKAAAAEKKRKAEEAAAAEAEAAALEDAITAAQTPSGAQAAAATIAADEFGWGDDQFGCLSSLWNKESGWNYQAQNGSSGAYGIPQALPGSKMSTVASDWETNPLTQIRWGLTYIQQTYGTPCSAWGHSQAVNWY